MRISHRHKFVFFANPKTGSESLRDFLDPLSDVSGTVYARTTPDFPFYAHMRPIEARPAFANKGWDYASYYSFTCVRNPWARMVSLYRMIKRIAPQFDVTFADWLAASLPDGRGGGGNDGERWRKYRTYSIRNFAGDELGKIIVHDVFRIEDVADLPERLRARGIPIDPKATIPILNRAPESEPYRSYYDGQAQRIVADRYAEEIEAYRYSF